MKKAIVSGANGFIGRYFVKELSGRGYEVHAIVRSEEEDIGNIRNIPGVRITYCDMEEFDTLPGRMQADLKGSVFYHFAWAGSSGKAREDYELQLWNAKCTVKAAEAAAALGCRRIVFAGSVTQLMYRDYLRKNGISPDSTVCYAVGKMAAEELVKCICPGLGIEWNWTYIANFYGVDDPTGNFINMLVEHYRKGIIPELTQATQLADFTYVTDIARAVADIGERGHADSSYYVGYGEPRPLRYFVECVRDRVNPGMESGIGRKQFHGLDIDFERIDYRKINRDTGFVPIVPFERGIELLIR